MLTYLATKLKVVKIKPLFRREQCLTIRRYFSSEETTKTGFVYESNFTTEEQKYILQQLNEADPQQLQRYSLPKNRIKKFHDWKTKNGKFTNLGDVLDVDGLGVKTLDKICKNILQGENGNSSDVKDKPSKGRGQFLTPAMNIYQSEELTSSLGVHLFANGVSWAKIERENNFLADWNFFELNLGTKKLSPNDALQLVLDVSKDIPASDVYVFEAPVAVTPTAQQSSISVAAYIQRVQLLSMLVTLLSTSFKHNPSYQLNSQNTNDLTLEPKVFFLRHRLPARLFRTLVGNEKVSAATTVSNILENQLTDKMAYTPITVNQDLHLSYNKQPPVIKEVLGQALFLTMAFMDICVYQNKNSLKIVSSNNR